MLHEVIFEAETPLGKLFDLFLLIAILASILAVSIESVAYYRENFGDALLVIEWTFTIVFTLEYGLRLLAVRHPAKYVFSFFGLVDLLALLPTYLSLYIAGSQSLIVIRAIRLLRVFRILKLVRYSNESSTLLSAMRASSPKIIVFLGMVLASALIAGTLMYLIEGEENGFTSIPKAVYWAIVTMTTVGYGDIAPNTTLGQGLASLVMILGYGIIAVPTGIVTAELAHAKDHCDTISCPSCTREGHGSDAVHCRFCGGKL